MAGDAYLRIYRPTALIGWGGCFTVMIDDREQGELWPKQARTYEVKPGHHKLRLTQGVLMKSQELPFSVEPGEHAEFACSRLLGIFGLMGLHVASASERAKMRGLVVE
jgi:hypothetical protein